MDSKKSRTKEMTYSGGQLVDIALVSGVPSWRDAVERLEGKPPLLVLHNVLWTPCDDAAH